MLQKCMKSLVDVAYRSLLEKYEHSGFYPGDLRHMPEITMSILCVTESKETSLPTKTEG